ncbi:MAG: polysaccharide deacetylase family protein [Labilithrix sp.]|nr:polysaccharide deacetylase family protein [Labilithrix sp.]
MSRRALASALASRVGLLELLERVALRPALIVLVYHRIARPEDCAFDRNVIEATPDQFDEQMGMLRRRHSVVGPAELRDILERPSTLRHPRVAVTFDDGYRDNYAVAFPILKSHGLQALFFVPTHFVGSLDLTWWDRIAYAVRHTKRSELRLEYPSSVTVRVDGSNRDQAVKEVLRAFKAGGHADELRFFEMLERASGEAMPREARERQFFSWDEAVEMERAGMGIGSHTHSHRILSGLSAEEQRRECAESRGALRERNLAFGDCLAYPVGGPEAFSDETKRHARDTGYRFAFSNYGGINLAGRIDPFDVKRIGMDLGETASQLRFRLAASASAGRAAW